MLVPTKVALWTHREQLPDWALKQQDMNGEKKPLEKTAIWYVDDIVEPASKLVSFISILHIFT